MSEKQNSPQKVLIVDQYPQTQAKLVKEIRALGHLPLVASNASDALSVLRQEPALVVLNLLLPHLSSLSFLGFKEAHPVFADIPLVVFADGMGEDSVAEAFGANTIGQVQGFGQSFASVKALLRRIL